MPSWAAASIDAAALGVRAGRGTVTAQEILAGHPRVVARGRADRRAVGRDGDRRARPRRATSTPCSRCTPTWWASCAASGAWGASPPRCAWPPSPWATWAPRCAGPLPARRAELLEEADRLTAEAGAVWGADALPPSLPPEAPVRQLPASVGGVVAPAADGGGPGLARPGGRRARAGPVGGGRGRAPRGAPRRRAVRSSRSSRSTASPTRWPAPGSGWPRCSCPPGTAGPTTSSGRPARPPGSSAPRRCSPRSTPSCRGTPAVAR